MTEIEARIKTAIAALPPAALPFLASGCVEAAIIAHRQSSSLDQDTRRAIRSLALIALEVFGTN